MPSQALDRAFINQLPRGNVRNSSDRPTEAGQPAVTAPADEYRCAAAIIILSSRCANEQIRDPRRNFSWAVAARGAWLKRRHDASRAGYQAETSFIAQNNGKSVAPLASWQHPMRITRRSQVGGHASLEFRGVCAQDAVHK